MQKRIRFIITILSGFILLLSCNGQRTKESSKTKVTVTIEPLRYLAEKIGGNYFEVKTFVPNGISPETYEPTPKQLIDLQESALYLAVGKLGFEQVWLDRLAQNAPNTKFVCTDTGIRLIDGHTHHHDSEHCHHQGTDPHVWTTPENMMILAENVCKALSRIKPELKDTFATRTDLFKQEMKQIHADLIQKFQHPKAQHAFLIYHPTLSYFAATYGFTQIAIEDNGKTPAPAQLQNIIARCKEEQIQIIFVQQEFDRRNAEIVARETGTKIVQINPLAYDWEKEIRHIAQTLSDTNEID